MLLNYWASWCVPCRKEAPLLQRWQGVMQSKGGTVLGVDVNDISDDGLSFARQYKLTYPLLRDGDAHSQAAFGVLAYPESFLIDRQGRSSRPSEDRWTTPSCAARCCRCWSSSRETRACAGAGRRAPRAELAIAAQPKPRTSLGDIEDEVMCASAARRSTSPTRRRPTTSAPSSSG